MPTISRSRVHPLVTPSTALLTRARAKPWTAACESFSRTANKVPSCCSTLMPAGNVVSSLPFGPWTATVLPSIFTVTPLGSGIGFFPIRDINSALSLSLLKRCLRTFPTQQAAPLPNFAEQLAAQALFARLPSSHHATRRGENVDAQPTQHPGDLSAPHVHPASRAGDAVHIRDHRFIVVGVFQVDTQDLVSFLFRRFEIGDVALFFENAGNLQLQLGSRNIHLLVPCANRIANARQHICDRIGQPHAFLLLNRPFASAILALRRRTRGDVFRPTSGDKAHIGGHSLRQQMPRRTSTTKTLKLQEFLHATPIPGNTSGRGQTCADRRADVRKSCSGCACASKTWAALLCCLAPSETSLRSSRLSLASL